MRYTGLYRHGVTYKCGTRTINQQAARSEERNVARKQLDVGTADQEIRQIDDDEYTRSSIEIHS